MKYMPKNSLTIKEIIYKVLAKYDWINVQTGTNNSKKQEK